MKWNSVICSKFPPEKRYLLCKLEMGCSQPGGAVAVGWFKFAGGDRNCPSFIVPGVGGDVVAWSDCLGDDFNVPDWAPQVISALEMKKRRRAEFEKGRCRGTGSRSDTHTMCQGCIDCDWVAKRAYDELR